MNDTAPPPISEGNIGCEKCGHLKDYPDLPHCIRTCEHCGRVMHVREPGEHGIGLKVREGDQFVLPPGSLRLSFSPQQSSGQFTKTGLQWFAEWMILNQLPDKAKRQAMSEEIETAADACMDALRKSPLLEGLNPEVPADADRIIELVNQEKEKIEFWRLHEFTFLADAKRALDEQKPHEVAWAIVHAERFRAMRIYKEMFEEPLWMAQSAKRLLNFLTLWQAHQGNSDEEFWQNNIAEHSYVLSQAFSAPIVFVGERAYVGGTNVDGTDSRFVDFLFSSETSKDALLIELKTPATKLLGSKYRGVYRPSGELSGAIVQILDYRRQLGHDLDSINRNSQKDLRFFNPRCLVIVGNRDAELKDEKKRRSFEVFRSGLREVEILTFDEMFRKVSALARLFNLVEKPS